MPSRKKSKPNPPSLAGSTANLASSAASSAATGLAKIIGSTESRSEPNLLRPSSSVSADARPTVATDERPTTSSTPKLAATVDSEHKTPRPSQSWYGGAPAPPPRSPASAAPSAAEKDRHPGRTERKQSLGHSTPNRRASPLRLSPATAIRSQPLTATTRLNISSSQNSHSKAEGQEAPRQKSQSSIPPKDDSKDGEQRQASTGSIAKGAASSKEQAKSQAVEPPPTPPVKASQTPPQTQSTWTSWFSKVPPPSQESTQPQTKDQPTAPPKPPAQSHDPLQSRPPTGRPESPSKATVSSASTSKEQLKNSAQPDVKQSKGAGDVVAGRGPPKSSDQSKAQPATERPRSWLGLWSGAKSNAAATETAPKPPVLIDTSSKVDGDSSLPKALAREKQTEQGTAPKDIVKTTAEAEGSGSSWAFWSRSPSHPNKASIGELAVAGSSSQSSPQRAFDHADGMPQALNSTQGRKRGRPASLEVGEESRTASAPPAQQKAGESLSIKSVSGTPPPRPGSKKESLEMRNLLLPSFKEIYPYERERATFLQQISQLFYGKPISPRHPSLIRDPPRIKRALTIGVHGYFPTPLVQTVIGRPTGTSIKFAEYAARSIHNYTQSQGYNPVSVEKIALEGEGRIEERLDILWKLLLNWIDKIRHADFIILACHSQGVPVAISLAAKLVGFGCVNGARIGVCAMAGVNLGPFSDYNTRWFGGAAGELFDFGQPESSVSKAYEAALDTLLRFGGKVLFVGSMDDQLVSLQSSTFGSAQHPNIYRAVWIDGRVHISDFLTQLVGFALKLRNLGVSDHGLIRELSNPLAGSLVGGEGHSRLYEDPAVYNLAVEFTAVTTSINTEVLKVDRSPSSTSQNPYILPFAVRGVLEEEMVRKELASEALELIRKFDDWRPTTKVLRDVKYRLEGVRSKL